MKKITIIVPAYNEELFLGDLLSKLVDISLNKYNFTKEIIVVNDGSTDATLDIAKKFSNVKIISQINKGKGAAVKTGISHATGEYILIQDADLEYDPNDIEFMVKCLLDNSNSAIYGSRILGAQKKQRNNFFLISKVKKQSLAAWLTNRFLSLLILILYRKWITDPLTGYKLYPTQFLLTANVKTTGFETDHELTAKLIKSRIKIIEVPISYVPRSKAEGKKIGALDGVKAVITISYFRFFS